MTNSPISLARAIGGDAALLHALQHLAITGGAVDAGFVDDSTTGYDIGGSASGPRLGTRCMDWASHRRPLNTGTMLNESRHHRMLGHGIDSHRNGVAVIQEVVNLLLLGGHVGRPGAILPYADIPTSKVTARSAFGAPTEAFLDGLEQGTGITMPRHHGYDVVNAIRAMEYGQVDVLMAMGGNLVSAAPDTDRTAAAIGKVGLVVHVSTKPNRSHLIPTNGDVLILPALVGRNSMCKTERNSLPWRIPWASSTDLEASNLLQLTFARNRGLWRRSPTGLWGMRPSTGQNVHNNAASSATSSKPLFQGLSATTNGYVNLGSIANPLGTRFNSARRPAVRRSPSTTYRILNRSTWLAS